MRVGAGVRVGSAKSCGKSGQAQSFVRGGGDGLRRSIGPYCSRSAVSGASGEGIRIVARGVAHGVSEETMKRSSTKRKATDQAGADEILPGYDLSRALPNKYASSYAAGSAVVVLEPDVAAAFPTSGEANEALRALAGIIQKHRSRRPASRRGL